eukprot:364820-Pyramimonas_sp.AAC.1
MSPAFWYFRAALKHLAAFAGMSRSTYTAAASQKMCCAFATSPPSSAFACCWSADACAQRSAP